MEKGKWSVTPHAPVQVPPKLIVTDGDHGVVFLFYSFAVDSSDVKGSLRKVVQMLKERGL